MGDLTIDYANRLVSLSGRPVRMTAIEYRTLAELSANAGRLLTRSLLLWRAWRPERVSEGWLLRDAVNRLRRKLGDDAIKPQVHYHRAKSRVLDGGGREECGRIAAQYRVGTSELCVPVNLTSTTREGW